MTRSCLRRTRPRQACNRWRQAGGPTTVLTRPDRARGDADHVWPELLPGGRAVLFAVLPVTGGVDAAQVAVLDRQTGVQTVVVRGGSHAHYVGSGHLVYAAANTLRAVAFDPVTLETRGTPVPVVPDVVTMGVSPGGGVDAVVAADGTLAYVRGVGGCRTADARVGRSAGTGDADRCAAARVCLPPGQSRGRSRIVVRAAEQEDDLWVWDVTRLTLTPHDVQPGWGRLSSVDPGRSAADLLLATGGRTKSLLAGGRRHRRGRAADEESQRSAVHRRCRPTARACSSPRRRQQPART